MNLELHQQYLIEEIFIALNSSLADAQVFFGGDFYVLETAVICTVTFNENCQSYAEKPTRFIWRPAEKFQEPYDVGKIFFPAPITNVWNEKRERVKDHLIFARESEDRRFAFLGKAHLGRHGYGGNEEGYSASFSLRSNLSRELFLKFRGFLELPQPLLEFHISDGGDMDLHYHQETFRHLGINPKMLDKPDLNSKLAEIKFDIDLPPSVKEIYNLHASIEILNELFQPHFFNNLTDRDLEIYQSEIFSNSQFGQIFPLVYESDGSWNIGIPLDSEADPKVLVEYDGSWHLFSETFSGFLEAWAFDYVVYKRDYYFDETKSFLSLSDLPLIEKEFYEIGRTHWFSKWYRGETFRRFRRGDKRILVVEHQSNYHFTLSAETPESFMELFKMPWSGGLILDSLENFDVELQKAHLR